MFGTEPSRWQLRQRRLEEGSPAASRPCPHSPSGCRSPSPSSVRLSIRPSVPPSQCLRPSAGGLPCMLPPTLAPGEPRSTAGMIAALSPAAVKGLEPHGQKPVGICHLTNPGGIFGFVQRALPERGGLGPWLLCLGGLGNRYSVLLSNAGNGFYRLDPLPKRRAAICCSCSASVFDYSSELHIWLLSQSAFFSPALRGTVPPYMRSLVGCVPVVPGAERWLR